MRPMLAEVLREVGGAATQPLTIGCVGISESDAVLTAQDVLAGREGIGLGVLAQPGDVQLVLFDEGAGARPMSAAAEAVCAALGDSCYAGDGKTLAEAVIRRAERAGRSIAVAESCTGGMIAAALTSVPGSSAVFLGGVVAYSNEVKSSLLGVPTEVLAEEGAVSKGVVEAMAVGALRATGADLAVATTGIAGPDGGTPEKPVGTVWFAVAGPGGAEAVLRTLPGDRTTVRMRATAAGLDMLRLAIDPPGR
jgi:nicotinamide-nucleotide amidase